MMSSVAHLVRDRTTTCTYLACVLDHAMNTQGRFTEANAVCQSHLSLSETAHDQLSALKTLGQGLLTLPAEFRVSRTGIYGIFIATT